MRALTDRRAGGHGARAGSAPGAGDPVGRQLAVARVLDVDDPTWEGDIGRLAVGDDVRVAKQRFEVRDARFDEHVVVADLCDLLLRVAGDEAARVPQQLGEVAIANAPQLVELRSILLVVGAREQDAELG